MHGITRFLNKSFNSHTLSLSHLLTLSLSHLLTLSLSHLLTFSIQRQTIIISNNYKALFVVHNLLDQLFLFLFLLYSKISVSYRQSSATITKTLSLSSHDTELNTTSSVFRLFFFKHNLSEMFKRNASFLWIPRILPLFLLNNNNNTTRGRKPTIRSTEQKQMFTHL